ncbi:hypothetical protein EJ04DRAFT_523568 [Polyplosphaeria fusca]|uniref:Uncharacterized protein n=1 Tax=Polyplosphaeria fusca TaxID=682080 RepID=A0A9P4R0I8_9PLEO|nr:hypothetical protein EJ04DRAFT_523568 [Polyplosphaeria fusca]
MEMRARCASHKVEWGNTCACALCQDERSTGTDGFIQINCECASDRAERYGSPREGPGYLGTIMLSNDALKASHCCSPSLPMQGHMGRHAETCSASSPEIQEVQDVVKSVQWQRTKPFPNCHAFNLPTRLAICHFGLGSSIYISSVLHGMKVLTTAIATFWAASNTGPQAATWASETSRTSTQRPPGLTRHMGSTATAHGPPQSHSSKASTDVAQVSRCQSSRPRSAASAAPVPSGRCAQHLHGPPRAFPYSIDAGPHPPHLIPFPMRSPRFANSHTHSRVTKKAMIRPLGAPFTRPIPDGPRYHRPGALSPLPSLPWPPSQMQNRQTASVANLQKPSTARRATRP